MLVESLWVKYFKLNQFLNEDCTIIGKMHICFSKQSAALTYMSNIHPLLDHKSFINWPSGKILKNLRQDT